MVKSAMSMVRDYKGFSDRVRSLSVIMRHREGDIIRQEIKQARETHKGKKSLAAIQDIGMKGLEFADWSCVAVGWNAVYERSLTEGLSEKEAVDKADNAVLQSQPSAREQDLSALFKNNKGAMQLIAPFTTALNVIWNQFTYDLPMAIKNKNYRFAVGMITGYAIAGAMVGLLSQGLRGDDDDGLKPRRFMYWAFSQFFDSAPLIGHGISALAEYAITGEKPRLYQSAILPAADEIIGAARSITARDFDKALQHGGAGVFLIGGGPWSGLKETGRFLGIGDDDGELSLHFEALLGQQIKK
jgi:hypothetical protein